MRTSTMFDKRSAKMQIVDDPSSVPSIYQSSSPSNRLRGTKFDTVSPSPLKKLQMGYRRSLNARRREATEKVAEAV
jgi:hypothetical protein